MTRQEALVLAVEKGYTIDKDGNVSYKGKYRRLTLDDKGYYKFTVNAGEGYRMCVMVHRLQAYYKFGDDIFKPGIVVRHLNGISTDNTYDNIEIGTHSDNMMDKPKDVRLKQAIYASSFATKHNNVQEIKDFYNDCKSYKKTMERFDIKSKGTLHNILKNR